jgi:hypothetical protein
VFGRRHAGRKTRCQEQAKGIYRDPVRSSQGPCESQRLRWLCLMLLAPVPFAKESVGTTPDSNHVTHVGREIDSLFELAAGSTPRTSLARFRG